MPMVSQFPGVSVKNSETFGPNCCVNGKWPPQSPRTNNWKYMGKTFRERPPVIDYRHVERINIGRAIKPDLLS